MHKAARSASVAALAAANQGKYVEMTKVLFKNFNKLNDNAIKKHAQDIGLDMEKYTKDYNSPAIQNIINKDIQASKQVGVRGVPALYVNGKKAKGRSLDALSQMVEKELKKSK